MDDVSQNVTSRIILRITILEVYHLDDHGIRIAVWHQARERPSSGHAESPRVVYNYQVASALLDRFCGKANAWNTREELATRHRNVYIVGERQRTCTGADDNAAIGNDLSQTAKDFLSIRRTRHGCRKYRQ